MYDQTYNATFHKKLESIQYNAPLAITSAIGRTSNKKLGLETIEKERVTSNCVVFLIFSDCQCPEYLFNIIPISVSTYNTRHTNNIPLFKLCHFAKFAIQRLEHLQENAFEALLPIAIMSRESRYYIG